MSRRPPDEQLLHDRVIRAIHQKLSAAGRICHTNPGQIRMNAVSGYYPDVLAMLVHERDDIVEAIYEVETWSTVEEHHAEHQWAALGGLGLIFYLVVPSDVLDDAYRLAADLEIRDVKVVGFTEIDDGVILFDQEIIPPL